jgi:hypothetical protein
MDDAKLLMRKAIVMLGHRTTLLYQKARHESHAKGLRKEMEVHQKQLDEALRKSRDVNAEIFDANNALAAIFEKVPNMRSIEFMDMLYNTDQYTEMDTDLRAGDIMAEFLFNGKV